MTALSTPPAGSPAKEARGEKGGMGRSVQFRFEATSTSKQ